MPEPNVTFVFELRSARTQALVRAAKLSVAAGQLSSPH